MNDVQSVCPQLLKNSGFTAIGHAFASQFDTDLPDGNTPTPQQLALTLEDVFIQDVHMWLDNRVMGMIPERLTRRAHGLADGFLGDAATPFLDDARPSHSTSDLLLPMTTTLAKIVRKLLRFPLSSGAIIATIALLIGRWKDSV